MLDGLETMTGKTIQIYLPDGNPRGIRIAEVTSRTVQAIQFPRAMLAEAGRREELNNVCLYVLVGEIESKRRIYIGETEGLIDRLSRHNRDKDFWTESVVFISKT